MQMRRLTFWSLASLMALIFLGIFSAISAANTVPQTRKTDQTAVIDANALKPTECAALNLTILVVIARGDSPGNAGELIIGTSGADTIDGKAGTDCILGGGGDDVLTGSAGADVILGGPGNDTLGGGGGDDILYGEAGVDALDGGANTDVCYGGGQVGDSQNRCETWVP
jgi:Ca2+-binding RTX toxin-like protein